MRSRIGLLFPGQGAQHVGMGREAARVFPAAAELFRLADQVTGMYLSKIMWEGPENELRQTKYTQLAILTHSLAILRIAKEADILGEVVAAAGHSLGEYSALVAAGVLTESDALTLVRRRAELMQEVGELRAGAMAAVIGLNVEDMREAVEKAGQSGIVVIANLNSPDQTVLSGEEAAVDRAADLAKEAGARKVIRLVVSGAFHSPLMDGVAQGLTSLLEGIEFRNPIFPVVPNVTASPTMDGEELKRSLLLQIESPVKWFESFEAMKHEGAERFIELGPGRVLAGLSKRIDRRMKVISVGDPTGIEALAEFGSQ